MKHNSLATRLWVGLLAVVLLSGVAFVPQPARALTPQAIQRAMIATVKILILDNSNKVFGTCSGTHLGNGYILTNWHCVGHTDLYGPDDTGMGLKNGQTYNSQGIVAIAPQQDAKQIPKPTFLARVVAGSPDVDVAVVHIFQMIDSKAQLPTAMPMAVMTQDDSDAVNVGDLVYLFGYPGSGGDYITYTSGSISGFDDQTGRGTPDSFKTDAPINPGNSGGLAIDDRGNQIGIPTFVHQTESGPGLGGIREINIAVPYIEQAMKMGNATPGPNTAVTPAVPAPTPGAGTGPFGPVSFGTDVQSGKLIGESTTFDSGAPKIFGLFGYQNMRNGMKWGWTWQLDGQTVIDDTNSQTWSDGAAGTEQISVSNTGGLPDGTYGLTLFVSSSPVETGTFTIGQTGVPAPQPPGQQTDTGVQLQGQIIDTNTQQGIAGAVIVVLKPGTTIDQWDQDKGDSLAAAVGVADQDGNFLTAPGLARGQTYTVIVGAANYQRRVFQDGLVIATDDPALLQLDPLTLQAQ